MMATNFNVRRVPHSYLPNEDVYGTLHRISDVRFGWSRRTWFQAKEPACLGCLCALGLRPLTQNPRSSPCGNLISTLKKDMDAASTAWLIVRIYIITRVFLSSGPCIFFALIIEGVAGGSGKYVYTANGKINHISGVILVKI